MGKLWVQPGQRAMAVYDPEDGALIEQVPCAQPEDMQAAIDVAEQAFRTYRRMPAHRRATILERAAAHIETHSLQYAHTIAREGIKTLNEAQKEVARCLQTLRLSAAEVHREPGQLMRFDQSPSGEDRTGWYQREPLGIIGAITPFNDPLNLVAHKVGPAIAAGCAIIVKPHEATPLSALKLAEAFEIAGLPEGLLQVVTGLGAEVGEVLVRDPRVAMISFTGGRQTGETIARHAGVKKLAMELGGNAPVIVMADADLDEAVAACVSGAYWAAGQNCLHVQRILVQTACYETFREAFVAGAKAVKTGPKMSAHTTMGPMIDETAAERVIAAIESALQAGARLLCGGTRQGSIVQPTALEAVPHDHPLAQEEIFGPVTLLYPFETEEEALELANGTPYGLHAGVFTRDLNCALRISQRLECGGVMINDSSDYRIDAMPFGGYKASGLGREGVRFAIDDMTQLKTVAFRH